MRFPACWRKLTEASNAQIETSDHCFMVPLCHSYSQQLTNTIPLSSLFSTYHKYLTINPKNSLDKGKAQVNKSIKHKRWYIFIKRLGSFESILIWGTDSVFHWTIQTSIFCVYPFSLNKNCKHSMNADIDAVPSLMAIVIKIWKYSRFSKRFTNVF